MEKEMHRKSEPFSPFLHRFERARAYITAAWQKRLNFSKKVGGKTKSVTMIMDYFSCFQRNLKER